MCGIQIGIAKRARRALLAGVAGIVGLAGAPVEARAMTLSVSFENDQVDQHELVLVFAPGGSAGEATWSSCDDGECFWDVRVSVRETDGGYEWFGRVRHDLDAPVLSFEGELPGLVSGGGDEVVHEDAQDAIVWSATLEEFIGTLTLSSTHTVPEPWLGSLMLWGGTLLARRRPIG